MERVNDLSTDKGDKWINASELIRSLSVDPYECMGCPEPEFLPELVAILAEMDGIFMRKQP